MGKITVDSASKSDCDDVGHVTKPVTFAVAIAAVGTLQMFLGNLELRQNFGS